MLNRHHNPILITGQLNGLTDLYEAVADVVYPEGRPVPRTLDGFADMLREYRVRRIIASHWDIPQLDSARVNRMFRDLGVDLVR